MKDYYQLMGVEREATGEEIKQAYRKLAKEYHPDRNPKDPDCEERLKEINEAYQILGDDRKRQQYDLFMQSPSSRQTFFEGDMSTDLFKIFMELNRGRGFGGCRGRGFGMRGCRRWPFK